MNFRGLWPDLFDVLPDQVDVQEVLEVLDGEVVDGQSRRVSSGVVDEAIDLPELLDRRVDQVLDVGLARHVALHEVANAGS